MNVLNNIREDISITTIQLTLRMPSVKGYLGSQMVFMIPVKKRTDQLGGILLWTSVPGLRSSNNDIHGVWGHDGRQIPEIFFCFDFSRVFPDDPSYFPERVS